MFKRLLSAALVFGTAALAPPALAQTGNCLPRSTLIEKLQDQFDESLAGGGMQTPEQLIEVWSSEETGSFTVFITRADGLSCVVATGRHWHSTLAVDDIAG